MAVTFMLAAVVVQASQCTSGSECTSDDEPKNLVSLLQTKLATTHVDDGAAPEGPLRTFIDACIAKERPQTCPFIREGGVKLSAHDCAMEMSTIAQIQTYLKGSPRKVLELGARYGTSSCSIADAVSANGGSVLSV